ncbi:MAG TPA: twin-arginine translocase TatA/TatE family subunit [Solirubrobacteraceae bacterium]|nr:twin-arginine translocase TatA/TatE family subunit [Solirubrobacteraceae bacterium]
MNSISGELNIMGLDNPIHIAFLLILLLLVFGAKRLPEMGRSLGDGMRGFKDAISGEATHTATPTPMATQQPVTQPTLVAQHEPVVAPVQAVPAAQPVRESIPA